VYQSNNEMFLKIALALKARVYEFTKKKMYYVEIIVY
jgi:hypothetical protein